MEEITGNKSKEKQQLDYLDKIMEGTNKEVRKEEIDVRIADNPLDYIQIDTGSLPFSYFYQPGTRISIRAATVAEVQAYSVVNDENLLDVTEKMNNLISSCVRVMLPGNQKGSYKDIKDGDRLFLIFLIRELTFQKGHSYSKPSTCDKCNHKFDIPFRASSNNEVEKTFEFYEMPEHLKEYYDKNLNLFKLVENNIVYKIAPPTIGIQEIFFENMKVKVNSKEGPNVSFNKVMPFLLPHISHITDKNLITREQEYVSLGMETWQDLNNFVDEMKFGLKGLKMKCPECGQEVHTDIKSFPTGAKGIFVVPSRFAKHNIE